MMIFYSLRCCEYMLHILLQLPLKSL